MILSSASSVFKELLTCSAQIVHISVPFAQLNLLVRFIYTGRCEVDPCTLQLFISSATFLQIKGLIPETKEEYSHESPSKKPSEVSESTEKSEITKKRVSEILIRYNVPQSTNSSMGPKDNEELFPNPSNSKLMNNIYDCKTKFVACREVPEPENLEKNISDPIELDSPTTTSMLQVKIVDEPLDINIHTPPSKDLF